LKLVKELHVFRKKNPEPLLLLTCKKKRITIKKLRTKMNLIRGNSILFVCNNYPEKKEEEEELTGVMKRKLLGEYYNNKVTLRTARCFNVLSLRGLQPDLCCCHD